jgi:hypothetical protein
LSNAIFLHLLRDYLKINPIFLDIEQRIVYKESKSKLQRVLFRTQEKPTENSKQLLCGFFYKASKALLTGYTKSWKKMGKEVGVP